MNPSNRLEEIKKDWDANHIVIMGDVDWLIGESARTEEAEAEIERLRVLLRMGWKEAAEKAEARVKKLEEGLEEQAELWDMAEQDLETAADCHRQVAFHVLHKPAEKARRLLAEKEKG